MFLLSFYLRGKQDPICLKYSTLDALLTAQKQLSDQENAAWVCRQDDHGSSVRIRESDIASVVAIDVAKEQAGSGEIALMNARANAKLNSKAAADPELRAAQHMGQLMGMNRQ